MPIVTERADIYALQVTDPNGQELAAYVFPLNIQQYQQREASRATITQTIGGAWLDDYGIAPISIHFAGTTGFRHRRVGYRILSNYQQLKAIHALWRQSKDRDAQGRMNRFWFYNFSEEFYWWAQINSFSFSRALEWNFQWRFEVDLTTILESREWPEAKDIALRFWQERANTFGWINERVGRLFDWTGDSDAVTDLIRYAGIAALRGELNEVLGGVLDNLKDTAVGALPVEALQVLEVGRASDLVRPFAMGGSDQSAQLSSAVNNGDVHPAVPGMLQESVQALGLLQNLRGSLPTNSLGPRSLPGSFEPSRANDPAYLRPSSTSRYQFSGDSRVHTALDGETLPGIAAQYYGDGSMWTVIADYNNLTPNDILDLNNKTLAIPSVKRVS
jgi:hypothetical protein